MMLRVRIELDSWCISDYMVCSDASDPYEEHFGCTPASLTDSSRAAVDRRAWSSVKGKKSRLGSSYVSMPEGSEPKDTKTRSNAVCGPHLHSWS